MSKNLAGYHPGPEAPSASVGASFDSIISHHPGINNYDHRITFYLNIDLNIQTF